MMPEWVKKLTGTLAGLALIFLVWWLLALAVDVHFVMPTPAKTARAFWDILTARETYAVVGKTLLSSLSGFLLAFCAGFLCAAAAVAAPFFGRVLSPFVSVLRALPTIGVTLFALLVFRSGSVSSFIGFLVIFPMVYAALYGAASETDKKLLTMAKVYGVSRVRQFWGITVPGVLPAFFTALISGFGLNIKVTISAEVIAMPAGTIGRKLQYFYAWMEGDKLFAWLIVAVLLAGLFELLLGIVKRYSMPWAYPTRKNTRRFFKAAAGFIRRVFRRPSGRAVP